MSRHKQEKHPDLTAALLREIYDLDPDTGEFIRKSSKRHGYD